MKSYRQFVILGLGVVAAVAMSASPARAVTLFTEDFEAAPASYTAAFGFGSANDRYFQRSNAAGILLNANITGNATTYLATQNINEAPFTFTTAAPATVTFNPINITNYNDLKLSFSAAGMPNAETENYLSLVADLNGDNTYETTIFNFLGTNNSAYTDANLGALTAAFANFSNVTIPQPSISTLNLRILTFNDTDSANEATGFDNLVVTGTFVPEPSTIAMSLMGLVGLVGFARRRKA